jgi:branched-subunit amino acid ABC-type transport system permease component
MLCFAAVGYLVIFIRNGSTGRYFASLRGSETAAASIGINGTRQRILLFSLSAAIAGLGGGLIALQANRVDSLTYPALFGIAWVVLVVSLGSRTVDGALNAALGFVLFQWLLADYFHLPASIALIGFGFGAITYARHPEGIVEFQTRRSILATQKGRVLKERAAAMLARGPLPKGYIPRRNVTLPVLAGTLLAIVLWLGRGIVANVEGLPVWLLVLCIAPSLCFVLGWTAMTERRLQRLGGTPRGWWILAGVAVIGAVAGYAATHIISQTPPFEDPQVLIDVPTGIAVLVGIAAGFAVAAFFLLPVQIQQVARQRDYREIDVTWRDGRGPTLWVGIGVFLGWWATNGGIDKTGWEPTVNAIIKGADSKLWPLFLLGLVATIVLTQWVGAVQGGMNELVMGGVDIASGIPLAEDGLPVELPVLAGEEDEEPLAPMAPTPTGGSD